MDSSLKYPLGLQSKQPATGEKETKKSTKLLTRFKSILTLKRTPQYRVIWASTLGELENEVNKYFQHRRNVVLIGRPFHDLSWWQALTHEGELE